MIEYQVELASPMDLGGVRLPRRQVVGKYCPWVYQAGQTDPGKSACTWKTHQQFEDTDGTIYSFYFTAHDEPIILDHYLTGNAGDVWKGPYGAGTSYTKGQFVSNGGLFWRAETGVQGVTPSETAAQWQLLRTYAAYSASTSYTVNAADPRKNSYVLHNNTIWRAIRASTGITPGTNESVWTRGDTCGKLLKSCKVRYQGVPILNSINIPSTEVDTNMPLPFGGFPGTRKFR